MLGTRSVVPRAVRVLFPVGRRTLARLLLAAVLLAFLLAAVALAPALVATLVPPEISIAGVTAEMAMAPDTPVTVSLPAVGATVRDVSLHESLRDARGTVLAERAVPVRLVAAAGPALRTTLRLERTDGGSPLDYDGFYRLTLDVETQALPFAQATVGPGVQEYRFATLTTPRLLADAGVARLRYEEPLTLRWNSPLADLRVAVTPPLPTGVRIDPIHREMAYVDLIGPEQGRRYEVRVTEAWGRNGAQLLAPVPVIVETAAGPKPLVSLVRLEQGNRIVLPWDGPLAAFTYTIVPPVASTASIDSSDRRSSYVLLDGPKQGQEYHVAITGAVGVNGAPLEETAEFTVATPAPLQITEVSPVDTEFGVRLDRAISITFGEPILDRAAAQAAIIITPSQSGRFEWPRPTASASCPRENGLPWRISPCKSRPGHGAHGGRAKATSRRPSPSPFLPSRAR